MYSSNSVKRLFLQFCKGRSSLIKLIANFIIVAICGLFLIYQLYKHSTANEHYEHQRVEQRPVVLSVTPPEQFTFVEPSNSFFKQKHNVLRQRIDWHNYTLIDIERSRLGPGEQGKAYKLHKPEDIQRNTELLKVNGYWAVVSDKISPNRSVPDIRHPLCRQKRYLKELPTASIVIIFYNEHLSVLMRTVHSVVNRAPAHLLKEVILVNDHSDKTELYGELEDYLANNFNRKAHVIHLPKRSGLITARIAGAQAATGDVLVFLDSHTEAIVNYLPPLLDPIAEDYKACVCPFIDSIGSENFVYEPQDEGRRGAFEWNFLYKRIDIRPGDQKTKADNFPSPIMAGGLFAISSKFFWELGGYDPGLDIWGGEQYELSFKIWLCGGTMVDSPCSRIGHIYKNNPFPSPRGGQDFLTKNFKRVAEVWMDEYKEHLYKRSNRYNGVDVGDISKQLEVKKRLQCKPFKYFLEKVAPDMLALYPPTQTEFAIGTIESIAFPNTCIDSLGNFGREISVHQCSSNRIRPTDSQYYMLGHNRDIEYCSDSAYCIDSRSGSLELQACNHNQGSQYFRYDMKTQQIKIRETETRCIEVDPNGSRLLVKNCDVNSLMQKWKWGKINEHNLMNWQTVGAEMLKIIK